MRAKLVLNTGGSFRVKRNATRVRYLMIDRISNTYYASSSIHQPAVTGDADGWHLACKSMQGARHGSVMLRVVVEVVGGRIVMIGHDFEREI